jgi:uncharacterized membrane protein
MVRQITIAIGAVLSLLGIGAFVKTEHKHATVLFPLFVGLPMALLGVVAMTNEERAADAMHAASGISALGLVGSLQGLLFPQLFKSTAPGGEAHEARTVVQAATAGLCAGHQALAISSFVRARLQSE